MIKMRIVYAGGIEVVCDVDENQKISPHFTVKELANNKAKDDIKFISTPRSRKFLRMVEEFRKRRSPVKGINVTSNYRTKSFNSATPNADPKSRHLDAEALDWWIGVVSAGDYNLLARDWENICILFGEVGAINFYTHGVHIEIGSDISYGAKGFNIRDYRGTKADW